MSTTKPTDPELLDLCREMLAHIETVKSRGHNEIDMESLVGLWHLAYAIGPSNCWTGTSGALAAAVRDLIIEIVDLRHMAAELVEKVEGQASE